jgi:cell division topological specificity factor
MTSDTPKPTVEPPKSVQTELSLNKDSQPLAKPDPRPTERKPDLKPDPKLELNATETKVTEPKPVIKPTAPPTSTSSPLFKSGSTITGHQGNKNTSSPTPKSTSAHTDPENPLSTWWMGLWKKLWTNETMPAPFSSIGPTAEASNSAKEDAKNRLRLVLMHDRTQLNPQTIEAMRDDLVDVISRYVEIDKNSLDLFLEQEDDTIALVANLHVGRRQA